MGRKFPGLYPEWGEINPDTGEVNKIHLIGHSMGGPTIRMLAQLINHEDNYSPLFNGEKQESIHSIVTISSPHDGSTATTHITNLVPTIQDLIVGMGVAAGRIDQSLYDFKLDHWGVSKQKGESVAKYHKRIKENKLWKTKDTALWDLNPEGALEVNKWVNAQPEIYYFSISNSQTYQSRLTGNHLPELLMNPFLYSTSRYIGYTTVNKNGVIVDSTWFENDGLVSTITMKGPRLGSTDKIVEYTGEPEIGSWNHLGKMAHYDHLDVVGLGVRDMRGWFEDMASLLSSIPE